MLIILLPLSPIVLANCCVPEIICSNSADRCSAKKAAVKAKMLAAAPAYAETMPPSPVA